MKASLRGVFIGCGGLLLARSLHQSLQPLLRLLMLHPPQILSVSSTSLLLEARVSHNPRHRVGSISGSTTVVVRARPTRPVEPVTSA